MSNPFLTVIRYVVLFQSHIGKKIYLASLLLIFAGLAEGVGILMLLPLFQGLDGFVGPAESEADSYATELVAGILNALGLQDSVVALLILISVIFVTKGALIFCATSYSVWIRGQFLRDLKQRLFVDISEVQFEYYASRDTGYFINIVNDQVTRVVQALHQLTQVGTQFFNCVIYIGFAFFVAWRFGLIATVSGLLVLMAFKSLNLYVRGVSRKLAAEHGISSGLLVQTLQGFKYLVATNQTGRLGAKVVPSINRLAGLQIRTGIANAFTLSVREPVVVFFIVALLAFHVAYLNEPVAPMLVSIILFYRGLNSAMLTQVHWQSTLEFIGSMELIDRALLELNANKEPSGNIRLPTLSENITLSELVFNYAGGGENVIPGMNLELPAHKSIAIVGPSGAGKTTVIDLITLLLRPKSGQIFIDGIDSIDIHRHDWRSQIGIVTQDAVVFDDTVYNNICMWTAANENDPELLNQVRNAAKDAYLHDFIVSLPDGYQTNIGERGVKLSGGQRQRLLIARELYRKPQLLILDEATSSLDSESELAIKDSIDRLKGKITLIIIAHRLSTVADVDHIYVLDKGSVIEEGSFDDLNNNNNSRFRKMVEMQKLE